MMKATEHADPLEAVLKVGGSLSRGKGLAPLCEEIALLGRKHRLLVVPGGGGFADQVRAAYRSFRLAETTAHRMALLAMDQYGLLLADLLPGATLTADLLQAHQIAGEGRVPVLLPSALLNLADPLPHSWQVTSDSIAAWIGALAGAKKLVLLKDVDGLYRHWPAMGSLRPEEEIDLAHAPGNQGGIDVYFPYALQGSSMDAWAINGDHPQRLEELLESGKTFGTHLLSAGQGKP
ncbi:MAG TPA: hypothetical protein VMT46_02520 [Anaerolineaceae bacterium]|nr:hypothetical protein [Anaerolineaceae bacterium]